MKPSEIILKMETSNNDFVNTLLDDSNELSNIENFSLETVDPLKELNTEATHPRCYRIDNIVFAEPLKIISNEENSSKGQTANHVDKEEMVFIDNVIIQKKAGGKYRKYHINIEDPSQLNCPQSKCTRTFASTKLLKSHIRKVHCTDRNSYICERCGRGFSAQYLLDRHAAVHSRKTVECPVCGVTLSRRTSLSTHLRSHSNLRPHQCVVCHKSFTRSSALNIHVKFVHRQGALECEQCASRFSSRKQWSQHMITHRKKYDA